MYFAAVSMKDYVKQLVNLPDLTWFTARSSLYCALIIVGANSCSRAAVGQRPYNLLMKQLNKKSKLIVICWAVSVSVHSLEGK